MIHICQHATQLGVTITCEHLIKAFLINKVPTKLKYRTPFLSKKESPLVLYIVYSILPRFVSFKKAYNMW